MSRGWREAIGSLLTVGIVLAVLVSMDSRVQTRFSDIISDPVEGGRTLGASLGEFVQALWLAARDQSLDNAPLLVFTLGGAILVLFMLRT